MSGRHRVTTHRRRSRRREAGRLGPARQMAVTVACMPVGMATGLMCRRRTRRVVCVAALMAIGVICRQTHWWKAGLTARRAVLLSIHFHHHHRPSLIHLLDRPFQFPRLPLGFGNAGRKSVPLSAPALNVGPLSLQSSLLRVDVLARPTGLVAASHAFVMDQFGPTCFPHAMLSRTPQFHVPPSPITTLIIGSCIIAHGARSIDAPPGRSSWSRLASG